MRILRFDSGEHFDDPNARWGDPSYVLEPGDPGYVPPVNQPPTKRKRMRRNVYFPLRQADQIIWLANFANKLPGYATTLGLTTAQVNAAVADARWLIYIIESWLGAVRAWSLACTDAVTVAQSGDGTALMALPVFTAPELPEGVTAVNTGALDRIFALVQIIKDSGKCSDPIGSDLGVVGAEQAGPDFDTFGPQFKVKLTASGVFLDWGWEGFAAFLDMIEFQVDRSDGKGFVFLANDTTPGYTDTCPRPAQPVKWKYRAIFRVGDQRVGQWSNDVSITVGG